MSAIRSVSALLTFSLFLLACPGPLPQQPADGGEVLPPPADGGHQNPPPDAGPEPLFSLGGGLVLDTGTTTPAAFKVGVLWFSSMDTAMPSRPKGAETGSTTFANPYPARWKLDLFAAPPMAGRSEFTTEGGGTGARSIGQLVLFRDVDGDGVLTLDENGDSTDELIGSSAGVMPFDADGPGLRQLIVWRSGTLGTDETGYRLGFNLVSLDEPFAAPVPMAPGSDVTLTVTKDPRHALTFCEAAYALEPAEYACGQLVFRTPRVMAFVSSSADVLLASVYVHSGERPINDATVRLNGTVVPSDDQGGYLMFELTSDVIRFGMNSVRVEAPGLEPVSLKVVLPRAPTFINPGENAQLATGEAFTVNWHDAEGATSFDVSITAENGMADFVTTRTNEATLMAPPTPGPATLRIVATADRPLTRHQALGMIDAERTVNVVAP